MSKALMIILRWGVAIIWSLCAILPLGWVLWASLYPIDTPLPTKLGWPDGKLTLQNYPLIFRNVALAQQLLNSVFVTLIGAGLSVLVAALAGFGLSQLPMPQKRWTLILFTITALIPAGAIWLGRFLVIRWFGLMNTHAALISYAFLGGSPVTLLLCWAACQRLPQDVIDSAKLETASAWRLWWHIALPMIRPALAATLTLALLAFWNDSISPALYLKSPSLYTWPVGLALLQQFDKTKWSLLMAACFLVTLPALLTIRIVQRMFLQDNLAI